MILPSLFLNQNQLVRAVPLKYLLINASISYKTPRTKDLLALEPPGFLELNADGCRKTIGGTSVGGCSDIIVW
jgi:hypothetical protein